MTTHEPVRRLVRWLFVNRRTGGITVAQWPNIPLGTYIVASVLPRVVHLHGNVQSAVRTISVVALIAWGLDEALRGVNPFRRLLGGVVLLLTVVHLFRR
ncbi:MAG TPA: hypothetical protein VGH31_09910 [Acidimicrobiales bacterium]